MYPDSKSHGASLYKLTLLLAEGQMNLKIKKKQAHIITDRAQKPPEWL